MTILVTGAAGDLGSRVAGFLLEAAPAREVALATRDPAALEAFAQRGAEIRRADFDDPASLPAAFAGAERMLLVSTGIVGERRRRQHRAALDAARDAGVRHVVYTSSVGMHPDNPSFVIPDHAATEAWLRESGMDFTILRMGSYSDILARAIAPNAVASGQWISHAGDGQIAFVSKDDCARAAVSALITPGHEGAIYDITGPELLSFRQAAAMAAELSGRPIEYLVPPRQETPSAQQDQAEAWIGGFSLADLNSYEIAVREGFYAICTQDVEKLTKRRPESLRDLYLANLDALRAGVA